MLAFRTLATVRHHAMVLTDHEFEVPLDYARPSGERLTVFARAVRSGRKSAVDLPWLVFLQGGPGFPGPRPGRENGLAQARARRLPGAAARLARERAK